MENPAQGAAAPDPAWPEIRHPLLHPVPVEGTEKLREIVLREPDVEALERIDALNLKPGEALSISQLRAVIAALSNQPDATIKKLHQADFRALGEKAAPLLEGAAEG